MSHSGAEVGAFSFFALFYLVLVGAILGLVLLIVASGKLGIWIFRQLQAQA